MKGFFRTMFLAGLVVLAVLCCGCGRESAGAWEAVDVAMGTMVRLKVYGPEEGRGDFQPGQGDPSEPGGG